MVHGNILDLITKLSSIFSGRKENNENRIPSTTAVSDVVLPGECLEIFNIYIVREDWAGSMTI